MSGTLDPDKLADIAYDEYGLRLMSYQDEQAFADYVAYHGGNVSAAADTFEGAYRGQHATLEDFAHDELMELDRKYKDAVELAGERWWAPLIDMTAYGNAFHISDNGHVFSLDV